MRTVITKSEEEELIRKCNFNEEEKIIFSMMIANKSRDEMGKKINKSSATVDIRIRRIRDKISNVKTESNTFYIYCHTFPNGKHYVGVCKNCSDRWNGGLGYAYNQKMYEDIKKYGWDNIKHKIVAKTSDEIEANILERNIIDAFDLSNENCGYNQVL